MKDDQKPSTNALKDRREKQPAWPFRSHYLKLTAAKSVGIFPVWRH
jgi:hypothetical protein